MSRQRLWAWTRSFFGCGDPPDGGWGALWLVVALAGIPFLFFRDTTAGRVAGVIVTLGWAAFLIGRVVSLVRGIRAGWRAGGAR